MNPKTSDIPQSVLDAIKSDAERYATDNVGSGNDSYMIEEKALRQIEVDSYSDGRKEQLQKDLEFIKWLVGFFDCDDFIDEPIWTGLSQGKEIKGTTIELYQEYLNSKK